MFTEVGGGTKRTTLWLLVSVVITSDGLLERSACVRCGEVSVLVDKIDENSILKGKIYYLEKLLLGAVCSSSDKIAGTTNDNSTIFRN